MPTPYPYPRIRLRPEAAAHVRAWMLAHGYGLRGLCRAAFAGDDSGTKLNAVSHLLMGGAVANSLTQQLRFRALASATGWPAEEMVAEQLETEE